MSEGEAKLERKEKEDCEFVALNPLSDDLETVENVYHGDEKENKGFLKQLRVMLGSKL